MSVQWYGSEAVELTYKDPAGKVANELPYPHDEPRLETAEEGRPGAPADHSVHGVAADIDHTLRP